MLIRISSVLILAVVLAGCGTAPTERALTGAGVGAAVGTAGAAMTGGSLATGAVVGGAVGAAAGALTRPDQIDLDPNRRD